MPDVGRRWIKRDWLSRRPWLALLALGAAITLVGPSGSAQAVGSTAKQLPSASSWTCKPSNTYSCISYSGYSGQTVWGSWGPGHNCVSYAAFRLSKNGAPRPWKNENIGNAVDWAEKAKRAGFVVNAAPAVGSIAHWGKAYGKGFGHLAYVERVTSTHIDISEDSYLSNTSGYSSRRRIQRSSQEFKDASFLHIADVVPSGKVSIQALINKKYVSAEIKDPGNTNGMLRARAEKIGGGPIAWEKFEIVGDCRSSCMFKSLANGLYVAAEINDPKDQYGMLRARTEEKKIGGGPIAWEKFRIIGDCSRGCAIQSLANGLYVSAEKNYKENKEGMLRARQKVPQSWEQFKILPLPAEASAPAPKPTASAPAVSPAPAPSPSAPVRKKIVVDNRVTNGMSMREDPTPARLLTKPWILCTSRGCNINGTERTSGQTYDAAVCQVTGERTTNGNDSSSSDDKNPDLYSSTRYYGVRLTNGTFGYVSEVWIRKGDRGGLGLPKC